MTFFQHLVLILGLLLAGGSLGRAADDGTDTSSTTSGSTSTTGSSTTTTHHKTHHTKTATTGTNSAPINPTATTGAKRGATDDSTTETAPSKTASARTSSSAHSATSPKTSGSSSADEPGSAAASSADATTTGSSTSSGTHHTHHHTTAAGNGTNATVAPATAGASTAEGPPAKASTHKTAATATGAAAIAGAATNQAASATPTTGAGASTATTTTGSHHRHHATTTTAAKPLPQPPIIVPETHPAIAPQPPTATATLPTPPPISGATPPGGSVPTVQTGLPVGRPGTGTTATLPTTSYRPAPPPMLNFPFKDYPPEHRARSYPWKTSIFTTVFWIGEGSTPLSGATNRVSAWDTSWVHNNGGADDQNDMSGYGSGSHASTLNPFYIALPYNDLAYPDKTQRWLPDGWYKPTRRGDKPVSACKDRWIEIKTRSGRFCFAQWEDVGPVVTDDAEYVFGPERPSAMQGRGLDVSPAVAKYLGIDSSAYTSWRFVDDADVLPGMWLRYDEQALLFRAIKEGLHGASNPRIQDMEEPAPDPDDSTRKRAGAAGGY